MGVASKFRQTARSCRTHSRYREVCDVTITAANVRNFFAQIHINPQNTEILINPSLNLYYFNIDEEFWCKQKSDRTNCTFAVIVVDTPTYLSANLIHLSSKNKVLRNVLTVIKYCCCNKMVKGNHFQSRWSCNRQSKNIRNHGRRHFCKQS